ncbi:hypothetical protein [Bacteriovorax sp. Seq25_V]|uniref:hypothetical protein n=1 Tax=Bacteriovorax sp. Seq25_V TaxID=1201288 RepID=UPI0005549782|nr:hypothetical protein [Bacteriovorax sp. Seq25_V]
MNFKQLIFLSFLLSFVSCGVKAPPMPEESSVIPSYLELNKTKLTPTEVIDAEDEQQAEDSN